ncbi:MAG: VOC family protein [Paracoccus sp. (in: a-proteobacteria)]|nr:VOC family protein [Paracoccus sp. (in: a-proteobacteria)]
MPAPELDHIVLTCADLDAGTIWLSALLGVGPDGGGAHAVMATHNRLWRLGPGEYLELIAPDPAAENPPYPRWFGLDAPPEAPRLTGWACRMSPVKPPEGSRVIAAARGDLRWRIAVPDSGISGADGLDPLRIDWGQGRHPSADMPDHGFRLIGLDLSHPKPPKLPLNDPRVKLIKAERAGMRAHISTPRGKVTL